LPAPRLPYWTALADPASGSVLGGVSWLVNLTGTKLAFMDRPITLILLTLLAVAELIADKLPKTPARTAPPGLIARVVPVVYAVSSLRQAKVENCRFPQSSASLVPS